MNNTEPAPLRVTLVTVNYAPEETGIAAYTTSLAEGLAANGHPVNVLTAAPHYPAWKIFPANQWRSTETRNGVRVRRVKSYVPRRPNFANRTLFEVLFGLRFALTRIPPSDVVILVSPALFTSLIVRVKLALTRRGTPTILWLQDRYSSGVNEIGNGPAKLAAGVIRALESTLAKSSDRVVVIHERWVPEVEASLSVPAARLTAIRNWTHVAMPQAVDVERVRERLGWGLRGEETVVLHSGNMGAKQGLHTVVAAARLVADGGLPIRFVLMGDGNQREDLVELGADCPALQFIEPLPKDQFVEALTAADVLLVNELPGLKETAVPSKLTSYFAAGKPVLAATDSASVTASEIVASEAGVVVAPGDPAGLVDGVVAVASDHRKMNFGVAGRRFVEETLSATAGVVAFEALLADVTGRTPSDRNEEDEGEVG